MKKMSCIVCDKKLKMFSQFQPFDGLHFYSYGHYGSTEFDPMDGSSLNIVVCDVCLVMKREKTQIFTDVLQELTRH